MDRFYHGSKFIFFFLLIFILAFLINGCARWPDGSNGGNGEGQKILNIKVEISEEGTINTAEGYYYIVFDTDEDSPFPPDENIDNWEDGYYYIRLDEFGYCFGEFDNPCQYTTIGNEYEKYFQVTINLDDIGDPNNIFYMNVISTDRDNETLDGMNLTLDLSINPDLVPSTRMFDDFEGDSDNSSDFDIIQVTVNILTP